MVLFASEDVDSAVRSLVKEQDRLHGLLSQWMGKYSDVHENLLIEQRRIMNELADMHRSTWNKLGVHTTNFDYTLPGQPLHLGKATATKVSREVMPRVVAHAPVGRLRNSAFDNDSMLAPKPDVSSVKLVRVSAARPPPSLDTRLTRPIDRFRDAVNKIIKWLRETGCADIPPMKGEKPRPRVL
eukprot:TRINITY_DN19306_c0_g1_i2.p1 TRINITY_DN19306_c0_g1~~TRINITY_DN19306_c0_g1_i2.p1  ORF type:complete len:184 (-),score=12.27 TRINITY_DN19306_c0_g1_i2:68-619(-)